MPLYKNQPGKPPQPRICIGHDTEAGFVACPRSMSGAPTHRKRCPECARRQDRYRRKMHLKLFGEQLKPEHQCLGHDCANGTIACDQILQGNRKRCEPCGKLQRSWRQQEYEHQWRKDVKCGNRTPTKQLAKQPKGCGTCCGLSERRPLIGLCKRGHPWRAEKIERGEVLHSSAWGEFSRNYSR